MKRVLHKILILLAATVLLASSCGRDKARVIPRSKMSKIYAEMLVMDQWIQNKPGLRTIADTSLVYEPILEKYGYDSEDYQYTVEYYMADPERFSRILRTTVSLIEKDLKALRKKQAEIVLNEKLKREIEKFEITMFQFYDEFVTKDGLKNFSDSIDVVWDTTYNAHRFRRLPRTDTIYEGPRMIVKDTVAVRDSLVTTDSLAVVPDSMDVKASMPKLKPEKISASNPIAVSDTMMKKLSRLGEKQGLSTAGTSQRQVNRPIRPQRPQRTQETEGNKEN